MTNELLNIPEESINLVKLPIKKVIKKSLKRDDNPNYVSNKDFTAAISVWIIENAGKKSRKEWTQLPEFVAKCFMNIIEHYALKGNWRNYTYIDEMKSEARLNCVKYAHNFDTNRGNAFAYFTQYVHNSFLQVLANEKKQANIKFKAISEDSDYNYNNITLYDNDEDEN